jgi:NAD(P)H-dependent FMN reductase
MKLAIVNGSPRGESSNSQRMTAWLNELNPQENLEPLLLQRVNKHRDYIEHLRGCDSLLFIFPLYVDSMPGLVKQFFEMMEEAKWAFKDKRVCFLIHSGFPEMIQSRSLQRYLKYFSTRIMEMNYLGTLIMGGSESMQMAPDQMYRRQKPIIQRLLDYLEQGKTLPEGINLQMNRREKMSGIQRWVFTINPFKNFYWNYRAKQHDHPVNIKAQPYG